MKHITIVGRPNVGKSTLFNKLIRRRQSITKDVPGLTRDRIQSILKIDKSEYMLTDMAGIENVLFDSKKNARDALSIEIHKQILIGVQHSDLLLLVIEPEATPLDRDIAQWILHKIQIPTFLIINKSENIQYKSTDIHSFDNILYTSAEHGTGIPDLIGAMSRHFASAQYTATLPLSNPQDPIKICILGQPNSGKSTLLNKFLHEQRSITSTTAGTTRDAITSLKTLKDNTLVSITDTAGIRNQPRKSRTVESLAIHMSKDKIGISDVIIVLIDAECGATKQDHTIIRTIYQSQKPLVLVLNKCDQVQHPDASIKMLEKACSRSLVYGAPIYGISALKDKHCDRLLHECKRIAQKTRQKIRSSVLNKWLSHAIKAHPPPLSHRKTPIKLKFVCQIRSNPLVFQINANTEQDIPKHYMIYLTTSAIKALNLHGIPLSLELRQPKNPYI